MAKRIVYEELRRDDGSLGVWDLEPGPHKAPSFRELYEKLKGKGLIDEDWKPRGDKKKYGSLFK